MEEQQKSSGNPSDSAPDRKDYIVLPSLREKTKIPTALVEDAVCSVSLAVFARCWIDERDSDNEGCS